MARKISIKRRGKSSMLQYNHLSRGEDSLTTLRGKIKTAKTGERRDENPLAYSNGEKREADSQLKDRMEAWE